MPAMLALLASDAKDYPMRLVILLALRVLRGSERLSRAQSRGSEPKDLSSEEQSTSAHFEKPNPKGCATRRSKEEADPSTPFPLKPRDRLREDT